jgi:hypothetical protein
MDMADQGAEREQDTANVARLPIRFYLNAKGREPALVGKWFLLACRGFGRQAS